MESAAAERTPLEDLITRAELASARMSARNPNRALLAEMATALVSLAHLAIDAVAKERQAKASESRIILP